MLIVQKYGGSSVADAAKIERVAGIIADTYRAGNEVVVVLSAQGDTTDDLIEKAREINPNPSKREMDVLLTVGEQISVALMAMQLEKMRLPAVSLTGWQIEMNTNSTHGAARIKSISTERNRRELDKNRGFLENQKKKLANENFVSRAPANVVAAERDRLEKLQSLIANLEESLRRLG